MSKRPDLLSIDQRDGQDRPVAQIQVQRWQQNKIDVAQDKVIDEVPIALVYNGISHVVMMASPADLTDFALGFSLTEGIIQQSNELRGVAVSQQDDGIELNLTISPRRESELKRLRRNMTGRTGCGLCGAESLEQAIRPLEPLSLAQRASDEAVQNAVQQLEQHQPLQALTGACHGAAWCTPEGHIALVREDIGRHNALDKLIGGMCNTSIDFNDGFVLVSSRASYEMAHKVVSVGIGCLVSVSAPTSLAVKIANDTNLQLIGFARPSRHVHYT